ALAPLAPLEVQDDHRLRLEHGVGDAARLDRHHPGRAVDRACVAEGEDDQAGLHDPLVRLEDPLAHAVERHQLPRAVWKYAWFQRTSLAKSVIRVSASITSSSTPAISARSANASRPIARQNAVWCGPPAPTQASAAFAGAG